MWWLGVVGSALVTAGGFALIRYGLTFPTARRTYFKGLGVPTPPAPTDQRGVLVSSGAVTMVIGLIATLIFFCIALATDL